jgi:predicted AAA+ superfamily ATPase
MKPWREIAVPHRDVLEGTFQQSEFAADITAVHSGKATKEYQDASAFCDRTFVTEGMRLLLTQVAWEPTAAPATTLLRNNGV